MKAQQTDRFYPSKKFFPFSVVVRYNGSNAHAWTCDFLDEGRADAYAARWNESDHVHAHVVENDAPEV